MWAFAIMAAQVAAAKPTCEDPTAVLSEMRTALMENRYTHEIDDRIEAAFGCQPLSDPSQLARLWVLRGMRHHYVDDDSYMAEMAFRSALRIDSQAYRSEQGTATLDALMNAALENLSADPPGQLHLTGLDAELSAALDGQRVSFPQTADAGLHLVQVYDRRRVVHATVVSVPSMTDLELDLSGVRPERTLWQRKRPSLFITGASGLALGTLAAAMALNQREAIDGAQDSAELEAALQREQRYANAAYGLFSIGVLGVGASFVF
ncbi:MAG: hypothetical protein AAFV53_11080 [Myxococcota bacterium]